MRKSKELLGLPVLDLQAGRALGKLRGFLIDPVKKAVVAYTVSESRWARDDRVIGIRDVYSVGKDAVTVREARKLVKALQTFEFRRLAENRVELYNTRVLTESGQYLGAVDEFTFDPADGRILGYYVTSGRIKDAFRGRPIISANEVLTIGTDAIIVREQVSTQLPTLSSSNQRTTAEPNVKTASRDPDTAKAGETVQENEEAPGASENPQTSETLPPASASASTFAIPSAGAGDEGPFFKAARYEPGVITIRGPGGAQRFAPSLIQKIDVVSLQQIDSQNEGKAFRWDQTVNRSRELVGELEQNLNHHRIQGLTLISNGAAGEKAPLKGKIGAQGPPRNNWQKILEGERSVLCSRDRLALLGKKVGADVLTAEGESLLAAGEAINERVVERAEETGSLYQLVLGAALYELSDK
ncbi:MAG: PRC-barrel domain-containing protein, partial [Syntrophothermus sp.]